MKLAFRSLLLAAAAVLTLGTSSFADIMFDYTTTVVTPSGGTTSNGGVTFTFAGSTGTNLDASFGAVANYGSVSFTGTSGTFSGSYDFQVTFKDVSSGLTQVVDFTGTYSGSVNAGGSSNVIFSTATPSVSAFTLGGSNYMLSHNQSSSPQLGGTGNAGTFSVLVTASSVPEPASIALLGMGGFGAIGLFRRFKSKAKA